MTSNAVELLLQFDLMHVTWQDDRRLQIHDFILQRSVVSRLTIGNFSHSRQTEHSTCNHDSQNGFSHDHDSQGILKNS